MTPEQFLTFADPLPEPMLLMAGSGVVLAGNRAVEKRLGVALHEVRGKNLADVVADSPDEIAHYLRSCSRSRSLVLGSLQLLAQGGEGVACRTEGTLLRPRTDGSEAVLLLRLIPKESAVGQFVALNQRIEDLGREIQRRKNAEAAARQEAERLRVTLHSIGDGVIVTDAEGRVQLLNPVAQAMTGWTLEEATGVPLPDVFRIVNEDTRQPVENPALRALQEGKIVGLANHTVLISKDGTERPIDDSAAPIRDERGDISGSVLVFRDISERKRSEAALNERVRLLALNAAVGAALVQGDGLGGMLQRCAGALVDHLHGAFARIWMLNPQDDVLELRASAGMYTHLDGPHSRVPVGKYKIGLIAQERKPHLTNGVVGDARVSDQEWAKREGMIAFAGYPLRRGRPAGRRHGDVRPPTLVRDDAQSDGVRGRRDCRGDRAKGRRGAAARAAGVAVGHARQHRRCRDNHRRPRAGDVPERRGRGDDRVDVE